MWSRKRLDIGWRDLAFGLTACLFRFDSGRPSSRLESLAPPGSGIMVTLSVRSGFDLLLSVLDLPRGSEVLVSALTIPDMVRIIEDHGLVAVPLDIEPLSAGPTLQALEQARSPRARAVIVAHLFGGRLPLDDLVRFARLHGLYFIEDCAQAFEGDGWFGAPQADASLFSFGMIKTATALGGGLMVIRDASLLARMRSVQAAWPRQSRGSYLLKILKCGMLKLVSGRLAFAALFHVCRILGIDLEGRMSRSVRGFAGDDLFRQIRRRPSGPLLAMLDRRMAQDHCAAIASRRRSGARLADGVSRFARCPGTGLLHHSFWVFPVEADDPARLIARLHLAGFDATHGGSLREVRAPSHRREIEPHAVSDLLRRTVYLPCYADMPDAEIDRLIEVVGDAMEYARAVRAF